MWKIWTILLLLALIVALPFLLRQRETQSDWNPDDPLIVVITPHNEAIRYEFERGFSKWHQARYGRPVRIEWRVNGTTEIMRYLASEYAAAVRPWWTGTLHKPWPENGSDALTQPAPPKDDQQLALHKAFRATDDAEAFSSRIDVFFGGGEFDHRTAFRQGLTVPPWPAGREPAHLFTAPDGTVLIPKEISGEVWRTNTLFGNAVSTFGICYNLDRLRDLGVASPPRTWAALADPVYFKQVGACDPTKSGSIAKAFEMIIHQRMRETVRAAGFTDSQIAQYEKAFDALMKQKGPAYKRGDLPDGVPPDYQAAVERGWADGVALVQLIGANARYFTDSSQKVPIDVSAGDAAVGMAIDFYGRNQAQIERAPDGSPRMDYLTPAGGSSVSCDPISLLRGAGGGADSPDARRLRRQVAVRFIEYVLSEDGQKLWTYRPNTPGGPEKFYLRRLPIRRDFYPSTNPTLQAKHVEHLKYAADDLADPQIDPYKLAEQFVYHPRWSADHFGMQRDLVRAMCMDSGDELRAAWDAIRTRGGPAQHPGAMAQLRQLPTVRLTPRAGGPPQDVPLTWRTAPDVLRKYDKLEVMKEWTRSYRETYTRVRASLEK